MEGEGRHQRTSECGKLQRNLACVVISVKPALWLTSQGWFLPWTPSVGPRSGPGEAGGRDEHGGGERAEGAAGSAVSTQRWQGGEGQEQVEEGRASLDWGPPQRRGG